MRHFRAGSPHRAANAASETVVEESWWRDGRKLAHREYKVDHEAGEYAETVTDPETGESIHTDRSPLTEHHRATPRQPAGEDASETP